MQSYDFIPRILHSLLSNVVCQGLFVYVFLLAVLPSIEFVSPTGSQNTNKVIYELPYIPIAQEVYKKHFITPS